MSARLLFANSAITTLAAPITSSATTATLATGTGSLFPVPAVNQAFKLTFKDAATGLVKEIVLVTSMSGDTIVQMARGQEGTTASAYLAGDIAGHFNTAGTQGAFQQAPVSLAATASVTINAAPTSVKFDMTSGAVTQALPTISSMAAYDGLTVELWKTDATTNALTVTTADGFAGFSSPMTLSTQGASLIVEVSVSLGKWLVQSFAPSFSEFLAADLPGAIVIATDDAANAATLTGAEPVAVIQSGTLVQSTTAAFGGLILRTPAETAAGVTPTYLIYDEMDPPRYGAFGNGTTTDTAALNKCVAVINAYSGANAGRNPVANWTSGRTYVSAPLTAITATNFTLNAPGCTLLALPNSGGGSGSSFVKISNAGFRCVGLAINGNQFNEGSVPTYDYLMQIAASGFILDRVALTNGGVYGLYLNNGSKGKATDCDFTNNADLGIQFETSSYIDVINSDFSYCGYGFKNTFSTNGFAGFGIAVRFQSHDINFVNCRALQTGRDGMNVNQGSYNIKFIGCKVWMAGDGGFTVASDQQSTGKPGDGMDCYNLEYIGCDGENCWSSGLAVYSPTNNIRIQGGKYSNNYRCAGVLSDESVASSQGNGQNDAFVNGIFIAPGSNGVTIDAEAYDDRQLCTVTASTGGVVTATGWVAGTMSVYPRVALYSPAVSGAGLTLEGYGTITAESAGSVTITTTAYNGVTLGSITAGWFITQRVQHNGVLFGTGCTGTRRGKSWGHLPGYQSYYGFKTMSTPIGPTGAPNNQNVRILDGRHSGVNLLLNPTWDTSYTTGWTYTLPTGATASLYTTSGSLLRSVGCLQLVGGSSAQASGNATLITSGLNYLSGGGFVELSVDVYALDPGNATLSLTWGSGNQTTNLNHPGGGYRTLVLGAYIPAGAAQCIAEVVTAVGATAEFDNAILEPINDPYDELDYSYIIPVLPT